MKRIFALICACGMLLMTGCGQVSSGEVLDLMQDILSGQAEPAQIPEPSAVPDGEKATVHFMDVGQGDSEFIELPDGKTILIDASTRSAGETVVQNITDLGYDKIDVVVATHPHEDHIGGLPDVIDAFDIGQMYMSNGVTNTKIFETLLDKIENNNIPVAIPEAGETLLDGEGYIYTCLGPLGSHYDELNDYSIITRLDVGTSSFLFTGDSEALCEQEMIDAGMDLDVDVLKVGHHGSSTSTSDTFLEAVSPTIAVISCSAGNDYGHPHTETLEKLERVQCTVLRTDQNGAISISTNGKTGYSLQYADKSDAA